MRYKILKKVISMPLMTPHPYEIVLIGSAFNIFAQIQSSILSHFFNNALWFFSAKDGQVHIKKYV